LQQLARCQLSANVITTHRGRTLVPRVSVTGMAAAESVRAALGVRVVGDARREDVSDDQSSTFIITDQAYLVEDMPQARWCKLKPACGFTGVVMELAPQLGKQPTI